MTTLRVFHNNHWKKNYILNSCNKVIFHKKVLVLFQHIMFLLPSWITEIQNQNIFQDILSNLFFQVILSGFFFFELCVGFFCIAKTCDAGWKDWTGTEWCYLLVHDTRNYSAAEAHCETLGAGLAQVLTQEENDFLTRK